MNSPRPIKVESALRFDGASTADIIANAKQLEELGFDRLFTTETAHDPFLPLALVSDATSRIELGTGIAVAFGRNPMNIANIGHDLNAMSQGRFRLGLGSQIKPHITKRFNMPWHGPAKQMREFIEATHAIWDCWYEGTTLDYQGEFYQYRLMTPEFSPRNTEFGRPKILMSAVGPLMTRTAAAVADGIIIHPFCTEAYLKEAMLPRIESELDARGVTLDTFEIQYPVFIATGADEAELTKQKEAVRYRLGFYGSTPAYKPVLDQHGWGDLQPRLNALTKEGKWDKLAEQIPDEMLETFAAVGEPTRAAEIVKERFGGVIDSVVLTPSKDPSVLEQQREVLQS